ncbi:MAG: hypothetical protein ACK2U4_21090 [Candidatus Promineifilaceae bacterium]|jgi:hypothetical protein
MANTDTDKPSDDVTGVEYAQDADIRAQASIFTAFVVTVQHLFGGFHRLFQDVTDVRHAASITYPLPALMTTGVLMFLLRLGARRQVGNLLRGNGPSAAKYQILFDVESCPHGDTLNYLYARSDVSEVQEVVTGMTATLIRRKVLYRQRLLDKYFLVVVDGTGMLSFSRRHCPYCMTRTYLGRTFYYHPVLEAKLVTPTGFVFSLMTEFIENPRANPSKQDCELKAFYRLAERLKQRFPRLPICLLLDGLFAGGPTFSICEKYHWKYLIVLQEDDLPFINEEFELLSQLPPETRLVFHTGVQLEIQQDLRWVNQIAYVDSKQNEHSVAVIECLETKRDADKQLKTTRFKWITNFNVTAAKVVVLANQGGRLRWKIENEGFNVQKNGGYALEHVFSQDATAGKIFYLLLQMAHLLAQLIEHGSLFRKAFPKGVGSAKNIAFRLLEAWRNLRLSLADFQQLLDNRIQIRFAPP